MIGLIYTNFYTDICLNTLQRYKVCWSVQSCFVFMTVFVYWTYLNSNTISRHSKLYEDFMHMNTAYIFYTLWYNIHSDTCSHSSLMFLVNSFYKPIRQNIKCSFGHLFTNLLVLYDCQAKIDMKITVYIIKVSQILSWQTIIRNSFIIFKAKAIVGINTKKKYY